MKKNIAKDAKPGGAAENARQEDAAPDCELTVHARAAGESISTQLQLGGMPKSNRQAEGMALNVIARTMAFIYEGALISSDKEDTPEGRAVFFAGMQPALMHMFMGITGSPQFQKSVAANREAAREAEEEGKREAGE